MGIGVPGCGKTTYLKPLADEMDLVYISSDDIREELTGNSTNHSKETAVWDAVHSRAKDALSSSGVVVDATFTSSKDRRTLIALAQQAGAETIIAYWFNVPLRVCLERNKQRSRAVPEPAIFKMYHRLKLNPPTLDEGFTEIIKIST
ncbi:MAG: putative kinase [Candidatus Saccharibacteria bacterium]|nr:putative kinase [Candidatus Saccharibacteria bacterium]